MTNYLSKKKEISIERTENQAKFVLAWNKQYKEYKKIFLVKNIFRENHLFSMVSWRLKKRPQNTFQHLISMKIIYKPLLPNTTMQPITDSAMTKKLLDTTPIPIATTKSWTSIGGLDSILRGLVALEQKDGRQQG